MSRYDPSTMTRVLTIDDDNDHHSTYTQENDNDSHDASSHSNDSRKRRGFFRLGRSDREKDAMEFHSSDVAAGNVTDSDKPGESVDTNNIHDRLNTFKTGDHVNFLLKGPGVDNDVDADADTEDYKNTISANEKGNHVVNTDVENYWTATEPASVLRDSMGIIPQEDEEEDGPVSVRVTARNVRRRSTHNSIVTLILTSEDLFGDDDSDEEEDEDDLAKYAAAMVKKDSFPAEAASSNNSKSLKSSMVFSGIESIAQTEKWDNRGAAGKQDEHDIGASESRVRSFKLLRSVLSRTVGSVRDGVKRHGTNDAVSHSKNFFDSSNDDCRSQNSYTSGSTFHSWIGLGSIVQGNNARGGSGSWDRHKLSLTPFVDDDGNSYHPRHTAYRPEERILKRCIVVMFVVAIVTVSGAIIGLNLPDKNLVDESLTRSVPSLALTQEDTEIIEENVYQLCGQSSMTNPIDRESCQEICRDHFCCFDSEQDGYNCQDDADKMCNIYSSCIVLVDDVVQGAVAPVEIEHVDSATLKFRISNACRNVMTSMGKLECHTACDEHLCCFDEDSITSCGGQESTECPDYEACAVLIADKNSNESIGNTLPGAGSTNVEGMTGGDKVVIIASSSHGSSGESSNPHTLVSSSNANDIANGQVESQVSTSESSNNGHIEFIPIEANSISSEGITMEEVDTACQNVSTPIGTIKCAQKCSSHMCCFEEDPDDSCADCTVYGSCVILGNIKLSDVPENYDVTEMEDEAVSGNADDQYGATDDDIWIADTESNDEYDNAFFSFGNETVP